MQEITRKGLVSLREDIQKALKEIGEAHGVNISCGKANFEPTNATIALEIAVINSDGSVETKMRKDYRDFASHYKLHPNWLDQEFRSGNHIYKIIGLNPRSGRYPVIATDLVSNKNYKLAHVTVQVGMVEKAGLLEK